MSLLWRCATCADLKYVPADRRVICYRCMLPMSRERQVLLKKRDDPMFDFFNLYLASLVRKQKFAGPSTHKQHRRKLAGSKAFLEETGLKSNEMREYLEAVVQRYQRVLGGSEGFGIDLVHVYDQLLDHRPYMHATTRAGWCQGIGAYWLKNRRQGVNIFPHLIYDNSELATSAGAPIKLMINQKILSRHKEFIDKGNISSTLINTMGYIIGGRSSKPAPIVSINPMEGEGKVKEAARFFHQTLSHENAPVRVREQELYIVEYRLATGGGHFMGLDMNQVEFFDPSYGVFAPTTRDRKAMVRFLFFGFLDICYPGRAVDAFKITKVA